MNSEISTNQSTTQQSSITTNQSTIPIEKEQACNENLRSKLQAILLFLKSLEMVHWNGAIFNTLLTIMIPVTIGGGNKFVIWISAALELGYCVFFLGAGGYLFWSRFIAKQV